MNQPATEDAAPSWLQPSWRKLGLAAAVAAAGFFLPQEIPLEWYPLNEPGTDLNYLEIACAADVNGEVRIDYDVASDGHQPVDSIRWPISPTSQTYTYAFPLPDAPITEMSVVPPRDGSLTIRQLRIINRRGEEIRRFPRDLFKIQRGITEIIPLPDGLKLVATPGAADPSVRLELFVPILPEGMNHRNLLRGLLSSGYLAMMLTIPLLAVLFVFYRPRRWRDFFLHAAFLASLALLFSAVGNRGLIRNSLRYARYIPPVAQPGLKLEVDLAGSFHFPAQLLWDAGQGMGEATSVRTSYEPHEGLQTLRFALPPGPIQSLRLDPADSPGAWTIRGVRVVDHGQHTRLKLPLSDLTSVREFSRFEIDAAGLHLATPAGASDPIIGFKPEAVAALNRLLAPASASRP